MANTKNETITTEQKEAIKAELKAEVEAEVRAAVEAELKAEKAGDDVSGGETDAQKKRSEERVPYVLPIIDGEPEEVNVTVNGKTLQILRGEHVMIPRMFAEVLDNQTKQMKYFKKYQEQVKSQETVVQ